MFFGSVRAYGGRCPGRRAALAGGVRVPGRLPGVALLLMRRARASGEGPPSAGRPAPAPAAGLALLGVLLAASRSGGGLRWGRGRRALRPCRVGLPGSGGREPRSVGQQRHRLALVAAEQHGPGDGGRAEAVAHAVERLVERVAALEGEARAGRRRRPRGWSRAMPSERQAAGARSSAWPRPAAPARWRGSARSAGWRRASVCERVARVKSSKRRRSTTVRHTRSARRAAGGRCGRRARRGRRRAPRASAAGARARAARPSSAGGRPTRTGRGSRLWASAWSLRPAARPTSATSAALGQPGDLADAGDPAVAQLGGGDRPDAPQPLDGQQVQEGELAVRAAPPAGRRAWPRRWPPWPGTSSAPPRP